MRRNLPQIHISVHNLSLVGCYIGKWMRTIMGNALMNDDLRKKLQKAGVVVSVAVLVGSLTANAAPAPEPDPIPIVASTTIATIMPAISEKKEPLMPEHGHGDDQLGILLCGER